MYAIMAGPLEDPEATRRERWLLERRKHITSTDAAAILGLGPKRLADVYFDKMGMLQPADAEPEHFTWGKRLQPAIVEEAAGRLGVLAEQVDPFALYIASEDPLIATSLDAVIMTHDGVPRWPLECKNVGVLDPQLWGADGTDEVPAHYLIQVQIQCYVMDADVGYLAALFGGRHLRVYKIDRDQEIIQAVVEASNGFWAHHIQAGIAPEVDDSTAWTEILKKRRATRADFLDAASVFGAIDLAVSYREKRAQRLDVERQETVLQNRLRDLIGEHSGLTGPGFRISYRQGEEKKQVDYQRALELYATWRREAIARLPEKQRPAARKADDEALALAMDTATTVKPGIRRFVPTFTEE